MPRKSDIPAAFRKSVVHEPSGRRIVRTVDFQRELANLNHVFTLREANLWIENYQSCFKDISTEEGERRTFFLYNPNSAGSY